MDADMPVNEYGDDELKKIEQKTATSDMGDFASDIDEQEVFASFR